VPGFSNGLPAVKSRFNRRHYRFDSFDGFEQGLDDYIVHWNTRGRQQRPTA
jgi:hypothetical protein